MGLNVNTILCSIHTNSNLTSTAIFTAIACHYATHWLCNIKKTLDFNLYFLFLIFSYFFPNLQGTIYVTRQIENKIICVVEPFIGSSFRIAICDLKTKDVRLTQTHYKNIPSIESAFANFKEIILS